MAKKRKLSLTPTPIESESQNPTEVKGGQTILTNPVKKFGPVKILLIVLAIVGVVILISRNKTKLLAASVNGVPISRAELSQRVTDRFGKQMIEAMIGETLILEEARKQNVTANKEEVTAKIGDIEKSLKGSMTLDQSLNLQGITRAEFESQVRVQLLIDKMLSSEATLTASEVDDYMKKNASQLTATSVAEKRDEAEKAVRNDKLTKAFSAWFTKVKDAAKIERYL